MYLIVACITVVLSQDTYELRYDRLGFASLLFTPFITSQISQNRRHLDKQSIMRYWETLDRLEALLYQGGTFRSRFRALHYKHRMLVLTLWLPWVYNYISVNKQKLMYKKY